MFRKSRIVLILVILATQKLCFAQNLRVTFTDIGKTKSYKINSIICNDSVSIGKSLNGCLIPLYSKGFIAASIDSFTCDSVNISAFGRMSVKYRWVKISPDSTTNKLLNEIGINLPYLSGQPVSPKLFAKYINSSLRNLEDNGYPFARIKLNDVRISKNCVNAFVSINKGSKITIDTIYLKGDVRFTSQKLSALINLRKGESYSESKIKRIDLRLKQQQYFSIIKPTEIEFLNQKARIYCYLRNRPSSRFWGLAGFYSDESDGKMKLNGDINLALVNSLRFGEKFNFAWNAPGKGVQNLNINVDWPYIFGWQTGVLGSFSLYRRDSTYINFNPKLSFSFLAPNGGRFLLNLDYKKSSFSSNASNLLSQYGNSSALLYGFGYEFNNYDNTNLPSRGILLRGNLNTGKRNINQKVSKNSNLIDGELFVEGFIPIYTNRFIVAVRSNSQVRAIYNTKGRTTLFENEMYRVGGMGTIRGFNQESILSSVYSVATVELHFRMSEGSGIYLFTDKGFVKIYEKGNSNDKWPLGLGIGLNMVTKAGLFNLSYAIGQGFGQSLGARDAKVHFGIATVF